MKTNKKTSAEQLKDRVYKALLKEAKEWQEEANDMQVSALYMAEMMGIKMFNDVEAALFELARECIILQHSLH
jgi:hypothetical protein